MAWQDGFAPSIDLVPCGVPCVQHEQRMSLFIGSSLSSRFHVGDANVVLVHDSAGRRFSGDGLGAANRFAFRHTDEVPRTRATRDRSLHGDPRTGLGLVFEAMIEATQDAVS